MASNLSNFSERNIIIYQLLNQMFFCAVVHKFLLWRLKLRACTYHILHHCSKRIHTESRIFVPAFSSFWESLCLSLGKTANHCPTFELVRVFVWRSVENSMKRTPLASALSCKSPQQRSCCSFPGLIPKYIQLLSQTVCKSALGVVFPKILSLYNCSISSSVNRSALFGLLPFPMDFNCFCFFFKISWTLINSLSFNTVLQKGSDWGRFVFLAVFFPNAQHKFFCQLVHLVWGNFLDFTIHVFAFKKLLTQFQIVKRFSLSVYIFLFFAKCF